MQVRFRVVLVAVLAAALGLLVVPHAAATDAGAESQFVGRINAIRESNGLAPLQVASELVGVARRWTDRMVADGQISHNPGLAGEVTADWTKLGENVGVGADVDSLMRAFVNSPQHYRNIVDPAYNYIGVGVAYSDDGRMFTTHDFMALGDAPVVTPPAPRPSRPAPAPEPPRAVPPAAPARVKTLLIALRLAGP